MIAVLMGSNADEGTTFLTDGSKSKEAFNVWANHTFGPTIGQAVWEFYVRENVKRRLFAWCHHFVLKPQDRLETNTEES
eukprot:COSAG06_NODE_556_length_14336_cov_8.683290_14_plen_79_part_00